MKAHLLDSAVPLTAGESYTALCGAVVKRSLWAYMWDEAEMGSANLPLRGTCRICRNAIYDKQKTERYVYGIIDSNLKDMPDPTEEV